MDLQRIRKGRFNYQMSMMIKEKELLYLKKVDYIISP